MAQGDDRTAGQHTGCRTRCTTCRTAILMILICHRLRGLLPMTEIIKQGYLSASISVLGGRSAGAETRFRVVVPCSPCAALMLSCSFGSKTLNDRQPGSTLQLCGGLLHRSLLQKPADVTNKSCRTSIVLSERLTASPSLTRRFRKNGCDNLK
jgi:hypothetical protein